MIRTVGVVVPAHDEEALLPGCLAALQRAARLAAAPVRLLVVADACTDQTVRRAREAGAAVAEIQARSVGAARAAGMRAVLSRLPGTDPADVWLATTDADTLVPPGWLARQLGYARQGWDVVLGTVTVTDWDGRPPHAAAAFAAHYRHGNGPHPHVHGANFGIRASAYLAAGGFRALRTAEDRALLHALRAVGSTTVRAADIAVQTSARRQARAPRGFSHLLGTLTSRACPGLHRGAGSRRQAGPEVDPEPVPVQRGEYGRPGGEPGTGAGGRGACDGAVGQAGRHDRPRGGAV